MTPTTPILDALATLLAGDATTIAPTTSACRVKLAAATFTPGPGLTPADMTEASFPGYNDLLMQEGNWAEFIDAATGLRTVEAVAGTGSWHWESSAAPTPSQTIYGFYITDHGSTTIYGSQRFPTPLVINAPNQGIDVPFVRFAFVPAPLN